MNTIVKTSGIALLFIAGCATPLTPEQRRDAGLAALNNVSSAEQIVEIVVEYDCPEVMSAAKAKLVDKIDELIICGQGDDIPPDSENWSYGSYYVGKSRFDRITRYTYKPPRWEGFSRSNGKSAERVALEQEQKFHAVSKSICRSIMLDNPKRVTADQVKKLYDEWGLDFDLMNELIKKEDQEFAHHFYDKLVSIDCPERRSEWEKYKKINKDTIKFSTVLTAFLKLDNPTAEEYMKFLKMSMSNWSSWKNNKNIASVVVNEIRKEIAQTAYTYLIITQGSDRDYKVSDPDMAFAKTYFDEEIWAEIYIASGRNKSGGFAAFSCSPEYRKNIVGYVKDQSLIKKMLMSATGFDASDDIGLRDCIGKLSSEVDVVEVSQYAVDEDVRNLALKSVKEYRVIADSIEAETNAVVQVRNARVLIRLVEKNASATPEQTSVMERMKKTVNDRVESIIETSKSKGDKSFVLKGFYVGMTEDDAEILIGWYYPNAEVEQRTVDNSFFLGVTGPNHGQRYLSVNGIKFCDADDNGTVTRIKFTAKMLYDWFGIEDSNQLTWVEKFRKKFNLPEFTFHIEQNSQNILGMHKIETVGTYYYRHPNGWKVTHYGDTHNSVHGNIAGERQHVQGEVAGGTLVLE